MREHHARIVRDVRAALYKSVRGNHYERAMAVHGAGAGDITFKIDVAAERGVESMARELGKITDCRVLCEGPGEIVTSGRDPVLRVLVDPIDGTRNIMADLRSAWVLTGIAAEDGSRTLTLQDIDLCVQTEIPTTLQFHTLQFVARRGAGCRVQIVDLARGTVSRARPWRAPRAVDIRSGYYIFLKYLPRERAAIAGLETAFYQYCEDNLQFDCTRIYDDQWLSAAAQLYLVSSGRARLFADLRAWLAAGARVPTIASHPYDLCAFRIATEAGSPVFQLSPAGELVEPFAPLDLETNVTFVAFVNEAACAAVAPALQQILRTRGRAARVRLARDYHNK